MEGLLECQIKGALSAQCSQEFCFLFLRPPSRPLPGGAKPDSPVLPHPRPERPALPCISVWARAILLTTPTVATVGCSLTIPIAFASDFVLHGKVPNGLAVLGAVLVVGGFYFVSDRKESVGIGDQGGSGSGSGFSSGSACCVRSRRFRRCLRLRRAKTDARCSPSPCSSPSSAGYVVLRMRVFMSYLLFLRARAFCAHAVVNLLGLGAGSSSIGLSRGGGELKRGKERRGVGGICSQNQSQARR